MKKLNNKGFTLIELLAVIVILAVIILIAMPNVTSMMEKTRKNAFVSEATEFAKYLQTAYTDSLLMSSTLSDRTLITGANNGYTYFCMTVDNLRKTYISKSDTAYQGIVEGFIPSSTGNGQAIYIVTMTNGQYVANGVSLTMLSDKSFTDGTGKGQVGGGNGTIAAGYDATATVGGATCAAAVAEVNSRITKYSETTSVFR